MLVIDSIFSSHPYLNYFLKRSIVRLQLKCYTIRCVTSQSITTVYIVGGWFQTKKIWHKFSFYDTAFSFLFVSAYFVGPLRCLFCTTWLRHLLINAWSQETYWNWWISMSTWQKWVLEKFNWLHCAKVSNFKTYSNPKVKKNYCFEFICCWNLTILKLRSMDTRWTP